MKLYALACCILALSAQAVRADAFLPGPDKYENSFIHTAAFTPVGEHTTEWSEKSRPDVRRYKTAAEYAIASSRARYADLDSLKKRLRKTVLFYMTNSMMQPANVQSPGPTGKAMPP